MAFSVGSTTVIVTTYIINQWSATFWQGKKKNVDSDFEVTVILFFFCSLYVTIYNINSSIHRHKHTVAQRGKKNHSTNL